jgi:hypothetical protein
MRDAQTEPQSASSAPITTPQQAAPLADPEATVANGSSPDVPETPNPRLQDYPAPAREYAKQQFSIERLLALILSPIGIGLLMILFLGRRS